MFAILVQVDIIVIHRNDETRLFITICYYHFADTTISTKICDRSEPFF